MNRTQKLLCLFFTISSFVLFNSHTGGEDVLMTANGCAECHSGGTSDGSITITPNTGCVGILSNTFFTVCVNDSDALAAGFNVTANGGTMTPGTGSRTGWGGPSIITHNAPATLMNGQACWGFNWQAPATQGTITFDVFGNATDGNGWFDGDAPYFISSTLEVKVALSAETVELELTPGKDHSVNLIWEAETNGNNDQFFIERSPDGINFETLFVQEGNSNKFSDLTPPVEQQVYYRVRQIDEHESTSFSPIETIFVSLTKINSLKIYPTVLNDNQPLNTVFTLSEDKTVAFTIIDNLGQQITTQSFAGQLGQNQFELELPNLSSGLYYVLAGDALGKMEAVAFVVR